MTSEDEQWMVQAQLDRLVVNWRKKQDAYPRFDATLRRFRSAWDALHEFLNGTGIEAPIPRLWEVTYVNRIPKGDLWESPADWPRVFPGLWSSSFASAPGLSLRGLRGQWVWDSEPERARLYVEPTPARSSESPPKELLIVTLTARGPLQVDAESPENGRDVVIENGMNLGHDMIVLTFDAIASDLAKEHWKRHA